MNYSLNETPCTYLISFIYELITTHHVENDCVIVTLVMGIYWKKQMGGCDLSSLLYCCYIYNIYRSITVYTGQC